MVRIKYHIQYLPLLLIQTNTQKLFFRNFNEISFFKWNIKKKKLTQFFSQQSNLSLIFKVKENSIQELKLSDGFFVVHYALLLKIV